MKNSRLTAIMLFVLLLLCTFEGFAQDRHWLSYEPAVVRLEGRLLVEQKYGPPNFGENPKTDAKTKVLILLAAKPINVHADQQNFPFNAEVRRIRRVQLLFNLKGSYKQFIGRRVLVTGTLFHAHTGGHYTDVVMDVRSINPTAASSQTSTRQQLDKSGKTFWLPSPLGVHNRLSTNIPPHEPSTSFVSVPVPRSFR